MSMNSNGPGSTRRATTSWVASSSVRSETQLHTRPLSSGCILRRNRNRGPVSVWVSARISTSAYSVNRSGQDERSLVIRQTWSRSASMTTELSVCPTVAVPGWAVVVMSFLDPGCVGWGSGHPGRARHGGGDGGDDLAERVAVGAVVGHLGAEPVVQLGLHREEGQGVQTDVGEPRVGVVAVRRHGEAGLLGQQVHEVGLGERVGHGRRPFGCGTVG